MVILAIRVVRGALLTRGTRYERLSDNNAAEMKNLKGFIHSGSPRIVRSSITTRKTVTTAAMALTNAKVNWSRSRAKRVTRQHSRKETLVELRGFEPLTFSLRTRRATNCATAPEST